MPATGTPTQTSKPLSNPFAKNAIERIVLQSHSMRRLPPNWPKPSQRKDGLWEAKGIDPTSGLRKSFYGSDQYETAEKAARSLGIQVDNTLYAYYVNTYFPTIRHRSQNWRAQVAWAMDKHISPAIGNLPLEIITRPVLQNLFNTFTDLAPSSIQKIKIVLSGILNLAEADDIIKRNPMRHVKLQPVVTPHKRILTPSDLYRLVSECPERTAPIVILTGFMGLRIGEACGAMRADIIDGDILEVQRQALQVKGGTKLTSTLKTPQSRRLVPIPAPLIDQLLSGDALFLAPNVNGKNLLPNNATRMLDDAFSRVGISRVSPHEMRHTFISILENEIGTPRAVAEELAGKSKDAGMGAYSKARLKVKREWMKRFYDHCQSEFNSESVVKMTEIEPK